MKTKILMAGITAVILIIIIGIFISSINNDTSNSDMSNNETPSVDVTNFNEDIDDDKSETQDNRSEKILITAKDEYDGIEGAGSQGELDHNKTYISDMLREKLNDPKAKEYNYRTVVHIMTTADDHYSNPELEGKIKEAQEKFNKAHEEYISIPMPDVDSDVTGDKGKESRRLFEEIAYVKEKEVRLLRDELYRLELEFTEQSKIKDFSEKLTFAKEIGATNVESIVSSSDAREDIFGNGFFMELSYDNIEKLKEHGGFIIRLALAERVEKYDIRIADSLTILLDDLGEDETIHVAVVSRIDRANYYAEQGPRYLAVNYEYNAHLFRNINTYQDYEQTYQGVYEYLEDILIRNNLTDKRIKVDPEYPINWDTDLIPAGFEAELTRDEIIQLAQDDEVKVIYPMKYQVTYYMAE